MTRNVKPLESLYFPLIQRPLSGLLQNVEGALRRRFEEVSRTRDLNEQRRTMLLIAMLKCAINSYHAVAFLLSDKEHPERRPEFVFITPPINRQLMDLWFSLVYIMDEFAPRALAYEQCGYREIREGIDEAKGRHGSSPDWEPWFEDMAEVVSMMERQIPLTAEQIADPTLIDYWLAPFKLAKQATKSHAFLAFLEKLLYRDTSNEAHFKPGGLLIASSFLLKEFAPDNIKEQIEKRNIHQYKFRHYCRTVTTLLGIVSEIELWGRFNNHEQLATVWVLLAGYNADAKDVLQNRYQALLQ